MSSPLRTELAHLAKLGAPIVVSQLAQSLMSLTDVYLVTPLGPEALGATGLGANVFFGTGLTIASILLCLDTLVSHAVGRGDRPEGARIFVQSLGLSLVLWPIASVLMWLTMANLDAFGIDPHVVPLTKSFIFATIPSLPALLFSFAATKYLQANDRSLPVMVIAILANVCNYAFDVTLIYGRFGFPALGVTGAAIATSCARWVMALSFAVVLWRGRFPLRARDFGIDRKLWAEMLRLGVPAAAQMALELGMFVLAGFLIARFTADQLAAHYILLQLASLTFMVPLGLSAAGSVRVGHAIGAGLRREAAYRGHVAIGVSALVMAGSAFMLLFYGHEIAQAFHAQPSTITAFMTLLTAAAAFQVFDGIQVAATGTLRGLGDTRSAFIANLAGHWAIAFPIALYLGFSRGLQAQGVWIGLMAGLIAVALALLVVWWKRTRALARSDRDVPVTQSA